VSVPPLVAVAGLEGGYVAGRAAIRGMSFAIPSGRTVAVLGPNGGGKTTLMRALLGELAWTRGEIALGASVAYVPQTERSRLDFPVSARDVALMGTYERVPWYRRLGREERRAADEALQRVGLADRTDAQFGELSGGQRQRVLIARALARDARILLLDEPLSGVDRPAGERILALLDELRDDGRAVLVSTHDIEQARGFDLVLCVHGEQVAFGPPSETLTAAVLQRTYGGELVVLEGGERAVVVQHHHH
jgi:manganese/iron transport system ATP-binding protein/manganese/zinc/iron transport system ATP- binding protein